MLKWLLIPITVIVVAYVIHIFMKWVKKREKKDE